MNTTPAVNPPPSKPIRKPRLATKAQRTAARDLLEHAGAPSAETQTAADTRPGRAAIQPTPVNLLPALLDARQLGTLLEMSHTTVKRLLRSGKIGPAPIRFSARLVRWSRPEVEAWVAAGCPSRKEWAGTRKAGGR